MRLSITSLSLDDPLDLRTALRSAAIEFLDIDEDRTVVIYQQAILMASATEGSAMTAQEFDVELREPPAGGVPMSMIRFSLGLWKGSLQLLTAPISSEQP